MEITRITSHPAAVPMTAAVRKEELAEEKALERLKERRQALDTMKRQSEEAMEQGEQSMEMAKEFGKIMTIYRRIARGDIVPTQDERKLMEYNFDLYQAAKASAAMTKNDDPEEYDSVDGDEKKETKQTEGGGEPIPAPPTPAAETAAPAPEALPQE